MRSEKLLTRPVTLRSAMFALLFIAFLFANMSPFAVAVSFRANVRTDKAQLVPLQLKYAEQVPASESEVNGSWFPDPKLSDRPVLFVSLPSGTTASVYSGLECGQFPCEPMQGQRLEDVARGVHGACKGFEDASCTCALEKMGVTCICEKAFRNSGRRSNLMDALDSRIRNDVDNQAKLASYEANLIAGLPKDDEDQNDEYESDDANDNEEYESSAASIKLIGDLILPKNEPGEESTVAENFGADLRSGSCDSECHQTPGNFSVCFADCKLRSCHKAREVATEEESNLMDRLTKVSELQSKLKPDQDDMEASVMWGAQLKQLAALLEAHLNSTTSAASDAVACEIYWLEHLDRSGEADALKSAREAMLASRSSLLSDLLGNMQAEVLAQRLREADMLLSALQQRFEELSGDALGDPDGSHAAAKVMAAAAECRRDAGRTLKKESDPAAIAKAKGMLAQCSIQQAHISSLRAKLTVLEEHRRNLTAWRSLKSVDTILGEPTKEKVEAPLDDHESALFAETARVRGMLLDMLRGTAENSPCALHTDCGVGQRCREGKCKLLSSTHLSKTGTPSDPASTGFCESAEQCGNGHQCLGDRCSLVIDSMPCNGDFDCGNAQKCTGGFCVSLFGVGRATVYRGEGSPCSILLDCGEHQHCIDGRCSTVPVGRACSTGSSAGSGWAFSGPSECGNGQICPASRLTCVPVPTGQVCGKDGGDGCGKGQFCSAGKCRAAYFKSTSEWEVTVPVGSLCDHDIDCDINQRCATPNSDSAPATCVDVGEMSSCRTREGGDNADNNDAEGDRCGNGQICADGACIATMPLLPCGADGGSNASTCDAINTICVAKKCRSVFGRPLSGFVAEGSSCAGSLECGPGQRCNDRGRCQSDVSTARVVDRDPLEGRIRGTDAPGSGNFGDYHPDGGPPADMPPIGASCSENSDCAAGERCVADGFCLVTPISAPCLAGDAGDCGNGLRCASGRCSSLLCPPRPSPIPQDTPCGVHSDCGDGQRCNSFKCAGVDAFALCTATEECGNGQMCHLGKCRVLCPGAACESDDDCGAAMTCGDGKLCVRSWDDRGPAATCPLTEHLLPSQKSTVCLARVRGSDVYPELKERIEKAVKSKTVGKFCKAYAAAYAANEKGEMVSASDLDTALTDATDANATSTSDEHVDADGNCVRGFARKSEGGPCAPIGAGGVSKADSGMQRVADTKQMMQATNATSMTTKDDNATLSEMMARSKKDDKKISSKMSPAEAIALGYSNHAGEGDTRYGVEGTETGAALPNITSDADSENDPSPGLPKAKQTDFPQTAIGLAAVVSRSGVDASNASLIELRAVSRSSGNYSSTRRARGAVFVASPLWREMLKSGTKMGALAKGEDTSLPGMISLSEKRQSVQFRSREYVEAVPIPLDAPADTQAITLTLLAKLPSVAKTASTRTLLSLDLRAPGASRSTRMSLSYLAGPNPRFEIKLLGPGHSHSSDPVARWIGSDARAAFKTGVRDTGSDPTRDEWVLLTIGGSVPVHGTAASALADKSMRWRMWQRSAKVDVSKENAWDELEIPLSLSWVGKGTSFGPSFQVDTSDSGVEDEVEIARGITMVRAAPHVPKPKAPPCVGVPCTVPEIETSTADVTDAPKEKSSRVSESMLRLRLGDPVLEDGNDAPFAIEVQSLLLFARMLDDEERADTELSVLLDDDSAFGDMVREQNRTQHVSRVRWELSQLDSVAAKSKSSRVNDLTLTSIKARLAKRLEEMRQGDTSEMRFERSRMGTAVELAARTTAAKADRMAHEASALSTSQLKSLETSVMDCLCGFHVKPCATSGEGNSCVGDYTCGAGQRCALDAPPPVCVTGLGVCDGPENMCGNGERCSDSGRCVVVAEGASCSLDSECGRNQRCLADVCIALYGAGDLSSRLRSMYEALQRERDRLKAEMERRLELAKAKAADELARLRALLARLKKQRAALMAQLKAQEDAGDLNKKAQLSRLAQLRAKLASIRKARQDLLDSRSDELIAQQKRDRDSLAALTMERKMRSELSAELGELEVSIRRAQLVRAARESKWALQKGENGTWDALSDWDTSQAISAVAGVGGDLVGNAYLGGAGLSAGWEAEREAGNRRGGNGEVQVSMPPAGVTPEEWEQCKNESAAKALLDAERVKVEVERRKWEAAVVRLARPETCHQLLGMATGGTSGVYTVFPPSYGAGEASREHYHGMRVYCDMETDGGGWTLVGYAEKGSLGSKLGVSSGDYDPSNRAGSANVNALWLVQSSTEMAFTWAPSDLGAEARPTAGLMSYPQGVKFPIPNAQEQTLAPSNQQHKCSDPDIVSVPVTCIGVNNCDMPKRMFTGTDSLGACYGHAYGLVSTNTGGGDCDWTLSKAPPGSKAIMIGLDGTADCNGVRDDKGTSVPSYTAIWVR